MAISLCKIVAFFHQKLAIRSGPGALQVFFLFIIIIIIIITIIVIIIIIIFFFI